MEEPNSTLQKLAVVAQLVEQDNDATLEELVTHNSGNNLVSRSAGATMGQAVQNSSLRKKTLHATGQRY